MVSIRNLSGTSNTYITDELMVHNVGYDRTLKVDAGRARVTPFMSFGYNTTTALVVHGNIVGYAITDSFLSLGPEGSFSGWRTSPPVFVAPYQGLYLVRLTFHFDYAFGPVSGGGIIVSVEATSSAGVYTLAGSRVKLSKYSVKVADLEGTGTPPTKGVASLQFLWLSMKNTNPSARPNKLVFTVANDSDTDVNILPSSADAPLGMVTMLSNYRNPF